MNDRINDSETIDTRATDFVFGELSPEEAKRFEIQLEQSPELRAEVESIREAIAAVQAELEADSRGVGDKGRRLIEGAIANTSTAATPLTEAAELTATDASGARRVWIGLAVAASVLLIAGLAIPALRRPTAVSNVQKPVEPESATTAAADSKSANTDVESERLSESVRKGDTSALGAPERSGRVAFGAAVNSDAGEVGQTQKEEKLMALDTQKGAYQDKRVSDFDSGAAQRAGERDRQAVLSGKLAQQGGRQAGAARTNALQSEATRNIEMQIDLPDLPDLDLAEGLQRTDQSNRPIANGKASSREQLGFDDVAGSQALPSKPEMEHYESDLLKKVAEQRRAAEGSLRAEVKAQVRSTQTPTEPSLQQAQQSPPINAPARPAAKAPAQQRAWATKVDGYAMRGTIWYQGERGRTTSSRAGDGLQPQFGLEEESEGELLGQGPGMRGDQYDPISDNPFKKVTDSPLSTFSIDVDTASYAKVRMYLLKHQTLPRPDAVRIEELLNYFSYDYQPPKESGEHPFAASVSIADCPWNGKHRLARVSIKGKVIEQERPASNLVFLLDVSGSMNRPNKLPLVVEGMKMLTRQLSENDSVAIVVYAGAAGMVLDSTCGDDKETILAALDRLRAGGSTNGGQGIQLAYDTARDNFITGGTNRVILCTDGDFNVGVTGTDQLVRIAQENAKSDIFLSVLGFGMGNHNDAMMEQISNKGNGNYAFIDSKKEAQKVLVEQMGGTLVTIAKDVKIQIDFNSKEVAAYRLIGYENRILAAQDFNDDKKDAGEIGAGHTVTALYELVPADGEADVEIPDVDESRYQKKVKLSKQADSGESLTLRLRYKQPTGTKSTLIEVPVSDEGSEFSAMDEDFKFAASVAAFGMLLRKSPHSGDATFAAVEEIAGDGLGDDKSGRRAEFLEIVRKAKELSGEE